MPELSAQSTTGVASLSPVMTDDLTTAPGDIPKSEVLARMATQRDQFRHDNTIFPLGVLAGQVVEVWAINGENVPLECAVLYYTTDGSRPDVSAASIICERMHTSWDAQAGYLTHWRAIVPAQEAQTVVRYRIGGWRADISQRREDMPDIWAQDGQGFQFHFSGSRARTTFAYNVEDEAPHVPTWAESAVLYHIFLDRFATDTPDLTCSADADGYRQFHGGTLRGVCAALPYLESLGVTCLWLSPLHLAESYHRYDATDFYNVDSRLGTNEDLKQLTTQAHERGMRVLLDFVPSHISWHHPAFIRAQQDRNAPTASWFTFDEWPDRYRCFLEMEPSLVSLNGDNEQARDYIIGSAVQWLRDYGVDGFRLDHAIGLGMDFWTAFRRATRAVSAEALSIGEVTDKPDYLVRYHGKLDSILDFPLASALRHTFAVRDWTIDQFDHFLFAHEQMMSVGPERLSFLDNHDMDRFLFLANGDVQCLKMAALCQFTLDTLPIIYYGTEIGMSQQADTSDRSAGGDEQARMNMIWDQSRWDQDLLTFYRVLIQLRKRMPLFRQGKRHTLHLDRMTSTYAYARTGADQGGLQTGDVVVLFNLSDQRQMLMLPTIAASALLHCLLTTSEEPTIEGIEHGYRVSLASRSGAIITL